MKYVKFTIKWGIVITIMTFVAFIAFRFGIRLRNDPWVQMVDILTNPIEKTATENYGYKPEFYFSAPKILELCHAIDKRNMDKVDRLLSGEILPFGKRGEKVDINTKGKDNMTLLLWAAQLYMKGALLDHIFFNRSKQELISDDKERAILNLYQKERLNCIEHLLVFGADPNVKLTKSCDIGLDDLGEGISVVFIAAVNYFPGDRDSYLPIVLKYGGDPNIVYTKYKATPLFAACNPSKTFGDNNNNTKKGGYFCIALGADHLPSPYNVGLLIDAGAEIEFRDKWRNTPLIAAAGGGNFDIVLMLLEAGADYTAANEDGENLAYFLYLAKHNNPKIDTAESIDPYYNKVVDFLKNKGYSLESAYAELGDQLKRLPEPPKEFNVKASDDGRRPFDPYADEWIQKRKKEQTESNNQSGEK